MWGDGYLMVKCDQAEFVLCSQLLHHELECLLQQRQVVLHATTRLCVHGGGTETGIAYNSVLASSTNTPSPTSCQWQHRW